MSQTPLGYCAVNPGGALSPLRVNALGQLVVEAGGTSATYDITTATVVKASPGYIARIMVQVAGSGTGTVNDCITTGAAAIANQIAVIPSTVGPVEIDWNCVNGIVVVPGTGQTLAVSWS